MGTFLRRNTRGRESKDRERVRGQVYRDKREGARGNVGEVWDGEERGGGVGKGEGFEGVGGAEGRVKGGVEVGEVERVIERISNKGARR